MSALSVVVGCSGTAAISLSTIIEGLLECGEAALKRLMVDGHRIAPFDIHDVERSKVSRWTDTS